MAQALKYKNNQIFGQIKSYYQMHLQQEKRFYPSLRFLTIQPIMTSKYLGCKDVVATWITPSFMYHCQGSLFKLLDRIQNLCWHVPLKFIFSKNATKIDEIFTVHLTLCSKCQIDGEDFVNFCGLLKKHELYFLSQLIFRLTSAVKCC